jgi:hypothetical protein
LLADAEDVGEAGRADVEAPLVDRGPRSCESGREADLPGEILHIRRPIGAWLEQLSAEGAALLEEGSKVSFRVANVIGDLLRGG